MSVPHDNVVWQSADGTWNRGFYLADRWYPDDGGEPEVEFRHDEFEWVSTGHRTEQAAADSWRGANPGSRDTVPQPTTGEERAYWGDEVERLDDLAAKLWADPSRRYMCHGTPKRRVPRFLARDIAKATADAAYYRLSGYANRPTDVSAETAELRARSRELTADERAAVAEELAKGVDRIEKSRQPGEPLWRADSRRSDTVKEAEALRESLRALTVEVTASTAPPAAGSSRAKTTPKSTAGSFAPKRHSAPDMTL